MTITFRWAAELPQYMNDVPEIVRAYAPYIVLKPDAIEIFSTEIRQTESDFFVKITAANRVAEASFPIQYAQGLEYKKLTKRFIKMQLYAFCRNLTGVSLPYGSLTGVRPTKLYYELIDKIRYPKKYLEDTFCVSPDRAELIEQVVNNQKGIYSREPDNVDIFINIPFCPTRCKYCSFISNELSRVRKQLPDYIKTVKAELEEITKKIQNESLNLRSIYVGGGTPTSLEAEELADLLEPVACRNYGVEFTVEAGRPDSITRAKLDTLAALGVTRISINPQTYKSETLVALGRAHTPEQIFEAYTLARNYDFDINMDLIAGLPNETFDDFARSLEKTLTLRPENITVHTLSIKRGAVFNNDGLQKQVGGEIKECVDYAREQLKKAGYGPYYMYRQKNMADNLENVGYCLFGKQCIYNIDYMEETNTILSAGAGAMSKFVYPQQNRIERFPNPKGLHDYLAKKCK